MQQQKTKVRTDVFESSSRPGTKYETTMWSDGSFSCTCPAWRFKKEGQPRDCRHIQEVERIAKTKFDDKIPVISAEEYAAMLGARPPVRTQRTRREAWVAPAPRSIAEATGVPSPKPAPAPVKPQQQPEPKADRLIRRIQFED